MKEKKISKTRVYLKLINKISFHFRTFFILPTSTLPVKENEIFRQRLTCMFFCSFGIRTGFYAKACLHEVASYYKKA